MSKNYSCFNCIKRVECHRQDMGYICDLDNDYKFFLDAIGYEKLMKEGVKSARVAFSYGSPEVQGYIYSYPSYTAPSRAERVEEISDPRVTNRNEFVEEVRGRISASIANYSTRLNAALFGVE